MRPPIRSLDAVLPSAILLAGIGVMAGERHLASQAAPSVPQQIPAAPTPSVPGQGRPGIHDQEDNGTPNPAMRHFYEQQAMKRADKRQKVIVDDTAKLVSLAEQLREDAQKGTLSNSSGASARKVEEIEKLAKTVKDKMREGQ